MKKCWWLSVQLFVTLWTIAPPGFSAHGILQARILQWVANPFSRGFSPLRAPNHISHQVDSLPSDPPGLFFFNSLFREDNSEDEELDPLTVVRGGEVYNIVRFISRRLVKFPQ